jgi:ferredoxin
VTYVITEPCIDLKDRSCIEECPVDCIYEGDRMLYIHPDECVDCGACDPSVRWWPSSTRTTCPPSGRSSPPPTRPSSPSAWSRSAPRGGVAKVGAVLRDAEFVANYQVPET